jgi:hypothetical protein
MHKILLSILLAGLIWSACTKSDAPDGGFDTPVFLVGLEADSIGGLYTAGLDGVYLFTRVERGDDRVLVMSGTFADASCATGSCPGSVRFEFRNANMENFAKPDSLFGIDQFWEYKSPFSDTFALHTVAIQLVTPSGDVYRSDILPQPQDTSSRFLIVNSERWESNERGESTWKMDVSFSFSLFSTETFQEKKVLGSGVIGVAYR